MATLRVRYRNGETDEWQIHERMNSEEVAVGLWGALERGAFVSFSTSRAGEGVADFGRAALRMSEVAMWHLEGLVDFPTDLGLWGELQDPSG